MDTVRIGCVKFLNTLPLVEGLAAWRGAEVVSAVPARLIDMLLAGEFEVGLVSLIDAARSPEPLALVPVGMIGCDGATFTVRLYSSVPLEEVTAVHADTDSHTSVALVRVILSKVYGLTPAVIDFDARERVAVGPGGGAGASASSADGWPETLLLIGDKVVTDAPPRERYPYQLDLGEAWKGLTGLPFVYAMWMCRESALAEGSESAARVRAAAAVLDRARRHNATRLDWVVASRAAERGWPEELATRYFGEYLRYEVTERERAGVERFLAEAAALGLAPARGVRWAEV